MSATPTVGTAPAERAHAHEPRRWWADRDVLLPVAAGVLLLAGLVCEAAGVPHVVALVLSWGSVVVGGSTFVPRALRKLLRGKLGISVLMTISAIGAVLLGYVEEAAALAFLYSIAEALEDKAMDRARRGLRALLSLVPATATVERDGVTVSVRAVDLQPGDVLVVRAGQRVATDGVVRAGVGVVDASAVTGESVPVDVAPGDEVLAGSVNGGAVLRVEATAPGTDNSLTTIVRLVEQAQARKGDRARLADRIAKPLVPGVVVVAVMVAGLGALLGDPQLWVTRALVVLVAASPCAIAIAVPVTVVSAIGAATRFGVVVKSGAAFERLGVVRHVAFDKTGTLTRNVPVVARVVPMAGLAADEVLALASAVERHSTHPLAAAVQRAAPGIPAAAGVVEEAGHGIRGTVGGQVVTVGSPRWTAPGPLAADVTALEEDGMTVVVVRRGEEVAGVVGVRDELRPEAPEVVRALAARGIGTTMLTGDNARTAAAVARGAGMTDVRAELRPQDKAAAVATLSRSGVTAMVGDGINDAPALAAAGVGIAMGAGGSDVAVESADVAFTGQDLRLLPRALGHARRGMRIVHQNIALSLLIITVLPPLAIAGVLNLAGVVLVHEVAEVVVILNGLRAALVRGHGAGAGLSGAPATPAPAAAADR